MGTEAGRRAPRQIRELSTLRRDRVWILRVKHFDRFHASKKSLVACYKMTVP